MLQTPLAQISTGLAAVTVATALLGGRWPERTAALVVAADWAGGVLLQVHSDARHHLQSVIFAVDVLQAAMLLALVLLSRRVWVLWGAALAFLLVLTHVATLLDARLDQWSYLTASYIWAFGLLLALLAGVALEGRRPAPPPRAFMGLRPSIPSATARSRS